VDESVECVHNLEGISRVEMKIPELLDEKHHGDCCKPDLIYPIHVFKVEKQGIVLTSMDDDC